MSARRFRRPDRPVGPCFIALLMLLVACGEPERTLGPPPPPPPPAGPTVRIAVSPPGLGLIPGGGGRLTAVAYDASGLQVSETFTWESADPAVVTVAADGWVTAVSAGLTKVRASTGSVIGEADVTVLDNPSNVAFTRITIDAADVRFEVLSYAADGSLLPLPRPAGITAIAAPDWSPDGAWVAIEVIDAASIVSSEDGISYSSDIHVFDPALPAGAPWRALTSNGRSRSPSWSPDGTRIAFTAGSAGSALNHVHVMDASGGAPVQVTAVEGSYSRPSWSPDGARLLFSDGTVGSGDILVVNADGTGLSNLTRSGAPDADPSWSPDGRRIAFTSNPDIHDGNDVYVMDADGTNLVQLFLGGWNSGPSWSLTGQYIAFGHAGGPAPTGIYVMKADGTSLVQLTSPLSSSYDGAPAWRR